MITFENKIKNVVKFKTHTAKVRQKCRFCNGREQCNLLNIKMKNMFILNVCYARNVSGHLSLYNEILRTTFLGNVIKFPCVVCPDFSGKSNCTVYDYHLIRRQTLKNLYKNYVWYI